MDLSEPIKAQPAVSPHADPPQLQEPPPVSLFRRININVFWLANEFHWNALIAIVIPSMVSKLLDPAQQSINLPFVIIWGTLVAVFINPLAGALSDHLPFRLGRRRPFLIIGSIINVLVLLAFAFTPNLDSGVLLGVLALLFFLLQCSNNFANAPWGAIIADQVPRRQRGLTAGFNGLAFLLGLALGSVVAGQIVNKQDPLPIYKNQIALIFLIIAAVQTLTVLYTVITVKETPLPPERRGQFRFGPFVRQFFFNPTRYPDLAWVLLARLLVMMGIWGIFYFLQYYADEVLGEYYRINNLPVVNGEEFVGIQFLPLLLLAALPSSLLGGWYSDRWGRKLMIYISGAMMTIVCLLFIFWQTPTGALVAAIFFGIGYGAYMSVDWALVTDVLPPTDQHGRFLGLWSAMGILPQVIGTSVSGIILQTLRGMPNHFGYTVLFLVATVYFALGTLVIFQVKRVK